MGVPVSQQLLVIATGLITGGGLGLIRHGVGALERRLPVTAGVLLDILFLLLAGGWLFRLGLETGGGMRLYLLLAVLFGWALYRRGLAETVDDLIRSALKCLQNLLKKPIK